MSIVPWRLILFRGPADALVEEWHDILSWDSSSLYRQMIAALNAGPCGVEYLTLGVRLDHGRCALFGAYTPASPHIPMRQWTQRAATWAEELLAVTAILERAEPCT